jgi:hypothetical protein
MASKGHEAQFPSATLSARYRFGQATFAGTRATSETRRFRTMADLAADLVGPDISSTAARSITSIFD